MHIKQTILCYFLGFQSMILGFPMTPGTSLWLITNAIQNNLDEASNLIDAVIETVVILENRENNLMSFLDTFAQESASRTDLIFNTAESIQAAAASQLNNIVNNLNEATNARSTTDAMIGSIVDNLQAITVEATNLLDSVFDQINTLDLVGASRLDQLASQSDAIDLIVTQISSQADVIQTGIAVITNNQTTIEATLAIVQQNGLLVNQALSMMEANNVVYNSKLDALSSNVAELNENDAKIFSIVDRLDTAITVGMRSINNTVIKQLQKQKNTAHDHVRLIDKKDLLNSCGIVITEPGVYMLTESLTVNSTNGICIHANNVTVDLNEFAIFATKNDVVPLSIENASTVTVKNGTISGGQGIVVTGSESFILENLQITYPMNVGINITGVDTGTISNCTIRNGAQAGIATDVTTYNLFVHDTAVYDCLGNGFDMQSNNGRLENNIANQNGGDGIAMRNGANNLVAHTLADANTGNGISIASDVHTIQIESCRVMNNGAIGCVDNGATNAIWMNNLSTGNIGDDYSGIRSVAITKATSYWHNVYGS